MSKELQDDETSGSDTESASISEPHIHSIKTESLFTESRAASILSQFSVSDQDEVFVPNKEQRERENKFLGYYECLIDNSKLSIPTISISTARIDLHVVKSRKTEVEEGKHLVLTKIKESPSIKNTSILVITGKGRKIDRDDKGNIINEKLLKTLSKKKSNYEEWTGTKFNEFPGWMQKVKHLLDGEPIKGLGNYEVFIKKAVNASEISEDTLELLKREAEKEDDVIHKLALAGFYLKGNERNNGNYYETSKCYMEAKDLCLKAAKLKSNEAKLCLGYIYSVSLNRNKDHNPKKAKKLFKKVAKKTNDKRMAGIAMRNIATLFHNEDISPNLLKKFASLMLNGKPLHLKKAEKWYERSLKFNDSQSAYQLGLLYENNFDGSINDNIENKNKAEIFFRQAVQFDENNLYAEAKLGRILVNSKKDINKGLKMLENTAEKGLDMGQTYLGEFYENAKNYEKAIELYSKAAKQKRGYYSHAAQCRLDKLNVTRDDILKYYRDERKYGYIETEENFERIL